MVDLSTDEQLVLDHVYHYRITTPQVMASSLLPHFTVNDAKYAFRQLKHKGLLVGGDLYHHQQYYALTPEAALEFYSSTEGGYIKARDLLQHYAMLLLCTREGSTQQKISPDRIADEFRDLVKKNVTPHRYYFNSQTKDLGYIRVDTGIDYRRAVQYLTESLRKHHEWKPFINEGCFVYTVITVDEDKAAALRRVFQAVSIKTEVCVIPELIHMIEPPQQPR